MLIYLMKHKHLKQRNSLELYASSEITLSIQIQFQTHIHLYIHLHKTITYKVQYIRSNNPYCKEHKHSD